MNPGKILIIQTAFLGDVILITPLVRATKELFPEAHIDVLVIPQTREVLAHNPHVREVLTFDKRRHKMRAFIRMVRTIRNRKYDLAISPHSSATTGYLMLLGGIPERLGFDRRHAARYLTRKVPHLKNRHKIDKNLHLLSVFTDRKFSGDTELFLPEAACVSAAGRLSESTGNGKPLIALAPGSIWFTKRWPQTYYVELARLLSADGFNLVFIGGPDEKDMCNEIISTAGLNVPNFAGAASVTESAALLKQCDLLVCNDSGAMHIANAVGTDVVAFFGPTVQSIGYYPYREHDKVFEVDLDCRPCGLHGGYSCPLKHHNCMKFIKPESVFRHIKHSFESNAAETGNS